MSFVDEARTESVFKPRTPCGMGRALDDLPEADRADVRAALEDRSITGEAISRVMARKFGTTVKGAVVQRHRTGGCSCG